MLIVCPSCVSTYRLPPEAAQGAASTVRCAECGAVFPGEARSDIAVVPPARRLPVSPGAPAGFLTGVTPSRPRFTVEGRPTPRRGSRAPIAAALVTILCGMAATAERADLVRIVPAVGPVFAAIGLPVPSKELVLADVASALAEDGPGTVLTLQGTILNDRDESSPVPNLRIVVRDSDQQSVYSWVAPAPQARLRAGEAVGFSSRLVSPPANGHDLVVSFVDRTDGAAAARVETGK